MGKPYYECHITLETKDKDYTERMVTDIGWTFSAIDKDIILGDGVKCYATKHFNERLGTEAVVSELEEAAVSLDPDLSDFIHDVIRKKVELVIYDVRQ